PNSMTVAAHVDVTSTSAGSCRTASSGAAISEYSGGHHRSGTADTLERSDASTIWSVTPRPSSSDRAPAIWYPWSVPSTGPSIEIPAQRIAIAPISPSQRSDRHSSSSRPGAAPAFTWSGIGGPTSAEESEHEHAPERDETVAPVDLLALGVRPPVVGDRHLVDADAEPSRLDHELRLDVEAIRPQGKPSEHGGAERLVPPLHVPQD